jgi:hypothetical protein
MITYSATLAISRELVRFVARPLWAERRGRRTPEGQQGADLLLAGRCDRPAFCVIRACWR